MIHVPLDIAFLVLECAASNLKQAHRHPRTDLGQLDALVASLDKDVMAHFDAVVDVLECDDAAAQLRPAFSWREEVGYNLDHALAQRCCKAFEDQMRIGLADSASRCVGNVMTQHDIVQGKARSWAVWKVRDSHGSGFASVLVQQDDIAQTTAERTLNEVGKHQISAVETYARWHQQSNLFCKASQSGARVSASGDENARVNNAGEMRVFVVEFKFFLCAAVGSRLVVCVVFA